MNLDFQPRRRRNADFWRALRYLASHRRLVAASVVCALLVGVAFAGGIGAMLPIMRVLINGDTLQGWVYRHTAEDRLGLRLVDDPSRVQIQRADPQGVAGVAGLAGGELLYLANEGPPAPGQEQLAAQRLLRELARPDRHEVLAGVRQGEALLLRLPPVPRHLLWAQAAAERLPSQPLPSIAAVFAIMAGITLLGNLIRFIQEYLSDKAAILAVTDLRRHLYDHVLHLPAGYFALRGSSDLTSRLVHDAATLQEGFKTVLGRTIQEPIKAALVFSFAMVLNWKLTLFIALFAPMMFLLIRRFGKQMRRAGRKALQSSSAMLQQLEGTLGGIRVVKSAGAERFERRRYNRIMRDLVRENLKMARVDAMSAPILESLTTLVAGAIVIYAGYLVLVTESLRPSTFIMVMLCLVGMADSLRKVSKVNNALQKSNAAAARIFETLAVPVERRRGVRRRIAPTSRPRTAEPQPRVKLAPIRRQLRFENVTFAYPSSPAPVLEGVNLTVLRGQSTAVVGRNGSGKTTLLSLLPRFYDPQQGRITIDGIDIRNVTLRSLRRQIGIVTQESVLFPGTIAENIAYGLPRATREQVVAAATRAFAHEFIAEKPQGYDTVITDLAGQLSGGQRQRLCIARAILRESPILILDEATSQVDAESEHLIQQAIESLMHERTTFVIAHRFSTILSADSIVVIDRGRIVGQGRHEELLLNCPTYQQLYERQLIAAPVSPAAAVTVPE